MAKAKTERKPTSRFRIKTVCMYDEDNCDLVEDKPELLPVFRRNCKSRAGLLRFLTEYAKEHGHLGFGHWSPRSPESLSVEFRDTDGGDYQLHVTFGPYAELRRDYPDDSYASAWVPVWGPFENMLLRWQGSDKRGQ